MPALNPSELTVARMETQVIYYHPTGYLLPGFEADMREIARCSDAVVFPVYESEVIQRAYPQEMARGFAVAREQGLRVIVTFRLGNLFAHFWPSEFAQRQPESWVTGRDGCRVPACCVNNPTFREFTQSHVQRFLDELEPDGVFLDEPAQHSCFCPHCRRLFALSHDTPMQESDAAAERSFARASLAGYLHGMCALAKERGLATSCCLIPWSVDLELARLVGQMAGLDTFGVDPYWMWPEIRKDLGWFVQTIRSFGALAAPEKRYMVWIQNFLVESGREPEVAEAIRLASAEAVDVLGAMYYWRQTADPALVWRLTREGFIESRGSCRRP